MAETPAISPGTKINLTITSRPTNAAATKTLVRLLNKDPEAKKYNGRLKDWRRKNYEPQRRGGRWWGGRQVKLHPIKAVLGATGTITASLDVLTDLKSVARFVDVKKA